MRDWLVRVATPFFAALYIIIFRGFSATIFVSLAVLWGVWYAAVILTLLYCLWGVVFYLILLQTEAFEHFKDSAKRFLNDKQGKVYGWIREKVFDDDAHSHVSPLLILIIFAIESPLTGVPLVRYAYPKNMFLMGIFWILAGCIVEVATWYFPIYGGGITILKAVMSIFHGG